MCKEGVSKVIVNWLFLKEVDVVEVIVIFDEREVVSVSEVVMLVIFVIKFVWYLNL